MEAALDPVVGHEDANPGAELDGVVRLYSIVHHCRGTQTTGQGRGRVGSTSDVAAFIFHKKQAHDSHGIMPALLLQQGSQGHASRAHASQKIQHHSGGTVVWPSPLMPGRAR